MFKNLTLCYDSEQTKRAAYILKTWPDWLVKWKREGLAQQAFSQHCPFGLWREQAQEIYDIKSPLLFFPDIDRSFER